MTTLELNKIKVQADYFADRITDYYSSDRFVLALAKALINQGSVVEKKLEKGHLTENEAAEAWEYIREKLKTVI